MDKSIFDKEKLIVDTILNCNKEIGLFCKDISMTTNKNLFEGLIEKSNIYHYNMLSLYSKVTDTDLTNLNESEIFNDTNKYIKNDSKNYYKYFNDVKKFLEGFELNIQKSLNENLEVSDEKIENKQNLDIFNFKQDLDRILRKLEKIDDFEKLSPDVLKIKLFSNSPIYIFGYDIINNLHLQTRLFNEYKLQQVDIDTIIYNKFDKKLLFCYNGGYIEYSIIDDNMVQYKYDLKFDSNFLPNLKEHLQITVLYTIYLNQTKLNIKFSDNLYNDVKFEHYAQIKKKEGITK